MTTSFLLIVQIILVIVLVIAVLLQKSSSIGLGAYSGSNESVFGAKGPNAFLAKTTFLIGFLFVATSAYCSDDFMNTVKALFKPIPATPPDIKSNPLTPAKIELGKLLYFDPRLSKSGLISCNTCHNVGMAALTYKLYTLKPLITSDEAHISSMSGA